MLAASWYVAQLVRHGRAFFDTFVWGERFTQLVTPRDAPQRTWFFYVETLWGDLSHVLPVVLEFLLLLFCGRTMVSRASGHCGNANH